MEDGGPAFPRQGLWLKNASGEEFCQDDEQEGMMLRDYFAAKAMLGLLSLHTVPAIIAPEVAENAYAMADAMLAERRKA